MFAPPVAKSVRLHGPPVVPIRPMEAYSLITMIAGKCPVIRRVPGSQLVKRGWTAFKPTRQSRPMGAPGARSIVAALSGTPVKLAELPTDPLVQMLMASRFKEEKPVGLKVIAPVFLIGSLFGPLGATAAAESHRVIVLDLLSPRLNANSKLLLVDIESGKVLAQVELGDSPQVGLSPKGDLLAVTTRSVVGGVGQPQNKLEIFQTSDLKRLESGLLPPGCGPTVFQQPPAVPTMAFSPDGREIIVPRMVSSLTDEKPRRWYVHNGVLSFVSRDLDSEGVFKQSRKDVGIPRCQVPTFLRLSDWPQVHVWNPSLGVVEVVDVNTGRILSRLPLDYEDDLTLKVLDPTALEKPEIGALNLRLGAKGVVISGGGRFAYYVPQASRDPRAAPGYIRKIDLTAVPPMVVRKGEQRESGLRATFSAASDQSGGLFVVRNGQDPSKEEPLRRLRVFTTLDLKFQIDIEATIPDINGLRTSMDGKYLYLWNRDQAKIAVLDVRTGKETKILSTVGKYPWMILALPETHSGKE
jgi:hypothetical protein